MVNWRLKNLMFCFEIIIYIFCKFGNIYQNITHFPGGYRIKLKTIVCLINAFFLFYRVVTLYCHISVLLVYYGSPLVECPMVYLHDGREGCHRNGLQLCRSV